MKNKHRPVYMIQDEEKRRRRSGMPFIFPPVVSFIFFNLTFLLYFGIAGVGSMTLGILSSAVEHCSYIILNNKIPCPLRKILQWFYFYFLYITDLLD